jgi:hypothetical protein
VSRKLKEDLIELKKITQNDDDIVKRVIWGVCEQITKAESNKFKNTAVHRGFDP